MGQLKNYHATRAVGSNNKGEIWFGKPSADGVLQGVFINNMAVPKHYIELASTGTSSRKYGTTIRCPGSFQVKAGDTVDKKDFGIFMTTENGDVLIQAPSGKIKLDAKAIDIIASGGHKDGNIQLTAANSKIIGDAHTITLSATKYAKIFSSDTVDIIGKSILNIYGGLIDCADGFTKERGTKDDPGSVGTGWEEKMREFE